MILFCVALVSLSGCGPSGVYHRVKRGQTLYRIARTYGVSLEELVEINDIEDPFLIKEGQEIFIPGASKVIDVPATALPPVRKKGKIFIRPVSGRITGRFWEKRRRHRHKGIDIAAPYGTPVKAAASGKVIYSGSGLRGYGKTVIIDHQNGYITLYSHMSAILVDEGERVDRGEVIGKVGSTGRTTGSHLHFEVRMRDRLVDPLRYFVN